MKQDRSPIFGQFNTNYYVNVGNNLGLLRVPKKNNDLLENIIYEYQYIGFTGNGGRVRRRTSLEQYSFSMQAALEGLHVLPPLSYENGLVTYPYLFEVQTLDAYFTGVKNREELIFSLVSDLKKTHYSGFIYGDRWAGNMLVDKRWGLMHIDFDLEISGRSACELDAAQMIYHTLWSGGEPIIPYLSMLIGQQRDWLDFSILVKYLRGLSRFLAKTKVGGLEDKTEELIGSIEVVRSMRNR